MKHVSIDLPSTLTEIKIDTFSDTHIGDGLCDIQLLKDRIKTVANDPNRFVILNGDLIDNATRTSVGDIYSQQLSPMDQMRTCIQLFEPIKNKILSVSSGNHEARTYRLDGVDLTHFICAEFGILDRYMPIGGVIFLSVGAKKSRHSQYKNKTQKIHYVIYHTHGRGGGRKVGAKAIRLIDMSSVVDADIYIHSHTHLPMIIKQPALRTDRQKKTIVEKERLFVNTNAYLKYGGYGQEHEYTPVSRANPVITLSGTELYMSATL